jgi:hypothetical protein
MSEYKTIPLTLGQMARVDAEDYEALACFKWQALWSPDVRSFYAGRSAQHGVRQMHRVILGLTVGDGLKVDHINHDTLDNRRENIRVATNAENCRNQRIRSDNKTGFRGVVWREEMQKYRAHIRTNGVRVNLGHFDTAEDAALAYNAAAIKHHGAFALINTPTA